MPRKQTIWYRKACKAYFTQWRGQQKRLADGPQDEPSGPTYLKALDELKALLELDGAAEKKDRNLVRTVLELYLVHCESRRAKTTLRLRHRACAVFCDRFGEEPCNRLTPFWVDAWADECRSGVYGFTWGDGGVRNALAGLVAAFNWAVKGGLLTVNPIRGVDMPAARSRSVKALIVPGDHAKIIDGASDYLQPLLVIMSETGCRPSEVAAFEGRYFTPRLNAMVFHSAERTSEGDHRHKTAGKGKTRTILLKGDALVLVNDAMKDHPTGPIFRTQKGFPWQPLIIAREFKKLRDRLGIPHISPYSYRHTFATRWLEGGRSVDVLAQLLGNTPEIIRRHYSHISLESDTMRRQFETFSALPANGEEESDTATLPIPNISRPA